MATNSRRRFQQEADNNIWLPTAANLRPIPAELNARGQYANNPYDCMTLNCLCPHFFVRNFLSENVYTDISYFSRHLEFVALN